MLKLIGVRTDTGAMDPETPTSVPSDLVVPMEHERPRQRSLLGLPMRLALLVLLAVAAFVVLIAGFADHQITTSAKQQAASQAVAALGTVSQDLSRTGFSAGDDSSSASLSSQLEEWQRGDWAIKDVVIATKGGNGIEVEAASPKKASSELLRLTRDAAASERPVTGTNIAMMAAARRTTLSDDAPKPVVIALRYDTAQVARELRTDRIQLWLGALIGGCLLSAMILLLLRQELFRPLDQLRVVMHQIGEGARGLRIGWRRSDELGLVAWEFDTMVARLEATQNELAKYVKHDPLTGLLTREAFTDRFAAELTRARREGYPITLLAVDVDLLEEINRTHDRAAGDQVLADIGSVIAGCTRPTDACGRTGGDSFHVALVGAEADKAAIVVDRIRGELAQRVGIGPERTRITCGYGIAEYPRHAVDQIALERMADAACKHAQHSGRDQALAFGPAGGYVDATQLVPEEQRLEAARPAGTRELSSTVHALARALDGIDPVLGGGAHSQRVARYAVAIARELGHGDGVLRELRSAAVLHDVGKVAVPPAILKAPEEGLDERQLGALRYHAWVSRTMIAGAGLASVADIVFHMPERWDGTGYPERLSGADIPEASRILRAAELLDDLTTQPAAPGGAPLSPFAAAGELKRRAGADLDPDISICLARLVREEGLVGNVAAAEDEAAPTRGAEAA